MYLKQIGLIHGSKEQYKYSLYKYNFFVVPFCTPDQHQQNWAFTQKRIIKKAREKNNFFLWPHNINLKAVYFLIAFINLAFRLSALEFCSEITAHIAAGSQPIKVI